MERQPTPRADIAISLFLIVICAATLWESRKIPAGSFEPLGSAPMPQAVAGLIILLCLLTIFRATLQLRTPQDEPRESLLVSRPADALAIIALTVIYCLVLEFRLLQFAVATLIFLIFAIGLLVRFQIRLMPVIALIAVIMGFGCQYLFTQVFVVDLPAAY